MTNATDVCGAVYQSPKEGTLACTKPASHMFHDDHSWQWVVALDKRREREDHGDNSVTVLLSNIEAGNVDAYIETLLAALHGRKRSLRGVRDPYGVERP